MESICEVLLYFFLFSFCGWVCETIFCSILERKPVNRGFLSGPVCPVYGFGGLMVVYLLGPLQGNYSVLFLVGMVACTVLEYITSWILEKLFHAKWWDYSQNHFNTNGRVCLTFSLIFGFLSIVAVELLYPPFTALMGWLPRVAKYWLAGGLLVIFALDLYATIYTMLQLNGKLEEIRSGMEELRQRLEQVQVERIPLAQRLEELREDSSGKYDELKKQMKERAQRLEKRISRTQRFQYKRIMRAFPNFKSEKYQEQLERLKVMIERRVNKNEKKEEK
ncbi:hypothetical protein LJC63_06480 [Ruminococcaceae bacterium OttesenSCG-928-L11]|nr:hypothetical protein [Ruminococcaceae bacterium OttesenSCG-928-L11]